MSYPPWVVLHVPHDETTVPAETRNQFLLDEKALKKELNRMTDHLTLALFADPSSHAQVVRAPVSRLVVDVERFADDASEPMSERGMGATYTTTSQLTPLRQPLSRQARDALMQAYYPHHERMEAAVANAIEQFGHCHVIDCHSFPSKALPYERADPSKPRPDICIGTDDFHTTEELASSYQRAFRDAGWTVGLNDPFAGAIVPASRYRCDDRVSAAMIEINRGIYLDENTIAPTADFEAVAVHVRQCCASAIASCQQLPLRMPPLG